MKALQSILGRTGIYIVGWLFVVVIFFGPYIVARLIPAQAYHIAEFLAFSAVGVSILAGLSCFIPAARRGAGVTIISCAVLVWLFLWVWSVLIVDALWGLVVGYLANMFLGIGAIFAAVLASLFTGHWSTLAQLVVVGIIAMIMFVVGNRLLEQKEAPKPEA